MSSFLSCLYILDSSPLFDVGLVRIFSHSVGCCFVLLTVFFSLQKLFSFMRPYLLSISVSVLLVSCAFKTTSNFLFIRVSVTGFMLRSLIHLDLSFVQGNRYGCLHSSTCQHPVMPERFVEDSVFFHCIIWLLVKN